jgi:hypothetical protein
VFVGRATHAHALVMMVYFVLVLTLYLLPPLG